MADITGDGVEDLPILTALSEVEIDGVIFTDAANVGSGTGGYNTFLALRDLSGNEDPQNFYQEAFNSDDTNPLNESNDEIDVQKTHTVRLADLVIITVDDQQYYEFRVDLNENNAEPDTNISLDEWQLYTSTDQDIESLTDLFNQNLIYDMDATGDVSVLLSEANSTGSGTDDYSVLVPVGLFAGIDPLTTYVYLYVQMGAAEPDSVNPDEDTSEADLEWEANGGFDEWNLQNGVTLHGVKFNDLNGNGVRDEGEPGIGGVVIYIDANQDGTFDPGERSAITDSNGNFNFFGVALDQTVWINEAGLAIDEVDNDTGLPPPDGFVDGDTNKNNALDVGETWQLDTSFVTTTDLPIIVEIGENEDPGSTLEIGFIGNFIPDPEIEIVKKTNGTDGDCPTILVGETVTWTYEVTNSGNVDIENVVVVDDNGTPGNLLDDFSPDAVDEDSDGSIAGDDPDDNDDTVQGDGILNVGETWLYTASALAEDGEYENIATVEGDWAVGTSSGSVDAEDEDCYEGLTPSIAIVKTTNGTDGVCPTILVGETVTWGYAVTNDGEADIENVVVVDDNGTPGNLLDDFNPDAVDEDSDGSIAGDDPDDNDDTVQGDGILNVGETWLYTASALAEDGEYENIAVVTGDAFAESGSSQEVTDEDEDCYEGLTPSIAIVKTTNGTDGVCPTILVGETVTWGYAVTNDGEADIENVVVVDDNGTPGNLLDDFNPDAVDEDSDGSIAGDDPDDNDDTVQGDGILNVGETWLYTASALAEDGEYENIAVVTGDAFAESGSSQEVTDEDEDCYEGLTPSIAIVKTTNGTDGVCPTILVGETVTWGYAVTNDGEADIENVVVVDDNGTPGNLLDDFNPDAVDEDSDGSIAGDDPDDNDDTVQGDGILNVGETWLYTASALAEDGEYENIAVVTGDAFAESGSSQEVTDEDEDCYEGLTPSIAIVKTTNGTDGVCPTILVGETVTWGYAVTNDGEADIENVVVVDDNGTPGNLLDDFNPDAVDEDSDGSIAGDDPDDNDDTVQGDGILNVGETWLYTASALAEDGEYENIAVVTGDAFAESGSSQEVTDEDEDCYEGLTPSIAIVKKTNGTDNLCPVVEVGSTVTWTYEVTNDGEADIENVVVVDDNGTPGNLLDDFNPTAVDADNDGSIAGDDVDDNDDTVQGDGILNVGETWLYEATGTAGVGEYENIATVTGDAFAETGSSQEVTDSEEDCYFGLEEGPGVRTPGFWQSKFGSQFWDGIQDNEAKAGEDCFADGELLYLVDSGHDDVPDTIGLLIGDYNLNGIEDEGLGEDTLFISLDAAKILINADQKDVQDGRYMIGRDLVATWLNFLAGNDIGTIDAGDGNQSPKEAIEDAVDWLQLYGDPDDDGLTKTGSKVDWDGLPAVKTSSAAWQTGGGATIHGDLDEYNNFGTVNGVSFANDCDDHEVALAITAFNNDGFLFI